MSSKCSAFTRKKNHLLTELDSHPLHLSLSCFCPVFAASHNVQHHFNLDHQLFLSSFRIFSFPLVVGPPICWCHVQQMSILSETATMDSRISRRANVFRDSQFYASYVYGPRCHSKRLVQRTFQLFLFCIQSGVE